jgi:hypothetical protein
MTKNLFDNIPPTPGGHFKLYFYAAVLHVIEQVALACESPEAAFKQFPFLIGYHNELANHGLAGRTFDEAAAWWRRALLAWESRITVHLPLRALREAPQSGLDHEALTLLMTIGLVEEDTRFGALFEALHGVAGQHRPTVGLLNSWWASSIETEIRTRLSRLQERGLLRTLNPDAPRMDWALQVPVPIWDTLRGETQATLAPGLIYHAPDQLLTHDELIVADDLRPTLALTPALLTTGEAHALIVRGPQHNGRRTMLGAIARAVGLGTLELDDLQRPHDERWSLIGPLATLLKAMPVIALDLAPGETAELARPIGYAGPIGVVLGKQGGVGGEGVAHALTLTVNMPDLAARKRHWLRRSPAHAFEDLEAIGERFRLTSGNIQRAAQLAQLYAALNHHPALTIDDVQQASRALNRQTLDTLAARLTVSGSWNDLAVSADTLRELHNLEARCRHRERLRYAVGAAFGAQLNGGVRALFRGPSGTGKTLAARLLAAVLQMDLYRLDLSSVVNKYIGETEKNLNQVFARAEELDVMLLLDEGDALLTQRTSVNTSNDRYANLETNFLLQRLESFEGILLVTTNAGDRIDSAFQRRMDVVVDFRPPDTAERWAIWQLHLPATHVVDQRTLQEVVGRCTLTGGQIRNAALHASLLALNNGGVIKSEYLEEAVQREYRKIGAMCPLRAKGC